MGVQFLEAFVGRVERVEKGDRIGDVDQHRDAEFAGGRPQRIEAGVVDGDQRPMLIADVQPERFPDFQPVRAARDLLAKAGCRPFAETVAVLRPLRPIDAAEHVKAIGRVRLDRVEVAVQDVLAPTAVEIDVGDHARRVEHVEQFAHRALIPAAAKRLGKVIMGVEHRKFRLQDLGRFDDQLGNRGKLAQRNVVHDCLSAANCTRICPYFNAVRRPVTLNLFSVDKIPF